MSAPVPAEPKKLLLATLVAALVAAVVLLVAILPAEYGIDPTGLGAATGFAKLNEDASPPVVVSPVDDSGPRALYEVDASWRLLHLPLAEETGHTGRAEGEDRVTIPLNVTNLTSLTATLRWNDTDLLEGKPTLPDLFELSIRAPDGRRSQLVQATNGPDGAGNVTVPFSWRSVPLPRHEEGVGYVLPDAEDASAQGEWIFVVRLYTAGGRNDTTQQDMGNNWTLTITGQAYELDLKTRADRGGDRVQLTLAPNQGVEYKFSMETNKTLTYRWSATAPLYMDLHSDHFDDPENFISAKIATVQEDEGTYTAPFYGRHGWYWRNDGTAPVTITLETSGDYTILGVSR